MYILIFFQLTSVQEAREKFRPNGFNKTVILQYLTNILDSSDMRGQNSVFVFNLGVHYSMSLNFTTYRDLVDSVIIQETLTFKTIINPLLYGKQQHPLKKKRLIQRIWRVGDSILVRYNSKYYSFKIFGRFWLAQISSANSLALVDITLLGLHNSSFYSIY